MSFANRRYAGSLTRLRREAAAIGLFASVRLLDDRGFEAAARTRLAETVRRHPRGYGLWTWKPAVIGMVLAGVPDDDIVVYCDAGCSLNAEGRPRLVEYLSQAAAHPSAALTFALDGTIGEWTKRATLAAFDRDRSEIRSRPMISATCLVVRNTAAVRDLMAAWIAGMSDLTLVDDSPSPGGEHPEFRGHRHDQSIFTLLAHDRGLQAIPDETWWPGAWARKTGFPIHARRWRQRLPWPQWWMRHIPWPRW